MNNELGIEILSEKNYILVTPPRGIYFWDILQALRKLFLMPEFQMMNDLWIFREGMLDFDFSDLYKIKDLVEKTYPPEATGEKTALVVETGIQQGLAESYASIGRHLPREIRVFSDLAAAEEWITSNH